MKSTQPIIISSIIQKDLVKIATTSLPFESCALLLGVVLDNKITVEFVKEMKNARQSSIEFSIEPDELFQRYQDFSNSGFDVVGIFHSHPGPPVPSNTDLIYMKINPIPWIIYSTTINQLGAFLFDEYLLNVLIKNE